CAFSFGNSGHLGTNIRPHVALTKSLESKRRSPVTKTLAALILVLALATFAAAEGAPGQEKKAGPEGSSSSRITITAAGLNCTTGLGTGIFSATSYSFGGTNPISTSTG